MKLKLASIFLFCIFHTYLFSQNTFYNKGSEFSIGRLDSISLIGKSDKYLIYLLEKKDRKVKFNNKSKRGCFILKVEIDSLNVVEMEETVMFSNNETITCAEVVNNKLIIITGKTQYNSSASDLEMAIITGYTWDINRGINVFQKKIIFNKDIYDFLPEVYFNSSKKQFKIISKYFTYFFNDSLNEIEDERISEYKEASYRNNFADRLEHINYDVNGSTQMIKNTPSLNDLEFGDNNYIPIWDKGLKQSIFLKYNFIRQENLFQSEGYFDTFELVAIDVKTESIINKLDLILHNKSQLILDYTLYISNDTSLIVTGIYQKGMSKLDWVETGIFIKKMGLDFKTIGPTMIFPINSDHLHIDSNLQMVNRMLFYENAYWLPYSTFETDSHFCQLLYTENSCYTPFDFFMIRTEKNSGVSSIYTFSLESYCYDYIKNLNRMVSNDDQLFFIYYNLDSPFYPNYSLDINYFNPASGKFLKSSIMQIEKGTYHILDINKFHFLDTDKHKLEFIFPIIDSANESIQFHYFKIEP